MNTDRVAYIQKCISNIILKKRRGQCSNVTMYLFCNLSTYIVSCNYISCNRIFRSYSVLLMKERGLSYLYKLYYTIVSPLKNIAQVESLEFAIA